MNSFKACLTLFGLLATIVAFALPSNASGESVEATKAVSFHKEIRPLFEANCNGCHQPAKTKGDYVMTDFASLLRGGKRETGHCSGETGR